jgi:hypothetical protein
MKSKTKRVKGIDVDERTGIITIAKGIKKGKMITITSITTKPIRKCERCNITETEAVKVNIGLVELDGKGSGLWICENCLLDTL